MTTLLPAGQSAAVNGDPSTLMFPKMLKQFNAPEYGVPSGLRLGLTGFPNASTETQLPVLLFGNEVGRLLLPVLLAEALRGFHPVQYLKTPFRAESVRTGTY